MSSLKANYDNNETVQGENSAKTARPDSEAAELAWMLRGAQEDIRNELVREVRAQARLAEQALAEEEGEPATAEHHEAFEVEIDEAPTGEGKALVAAEPQRDWSSAIDLVQEACEAIRIAEERVAELERQGADQMEEIAELTQRLRLQEQRAEDAETQAAQTLARAREAEQWLSRMHDAITNGLGRSLKTNAG